MPQSSIEQAALERASLMYGPFDTRNNKKSSVPQTDSKPETPKKQVQIVDNNQQTNAPKGNENFLDILMKDKEKSLIMLLIVILANDGADTTLLLALMYLII